MRSSPDASRAKYCAAWTACGRQVRPRRYLLSSRPSRYNATRSGSVGRVDSAVAQALGQHQHRGREPVATQMRALPGEFGILRRDSRGRAAAPHRAALIVLAVCTHRDEWTGGQFAVGTVEGDVQVPARLVHLPVVQRLAALIGLRDEPSPSRCRGPASGPTYRGDPHARRLDAAAIARPSSGSMIAGESRKADCPHAARQFEHRPRLSRRRRAVHADRCEPAIGHCTGCACRGHPRLRRDRLLPARPRTTTASRSSLRISTVASARSRPGSVSASATSPRCKRIDGRRARRRKRDGSVRQAQHDAAGVVIAVCAMSPWRHRTVMVPASSAASSEASGRTATGRVRSAWRWTAARPRPR